MVFVSVKVQHPAHKYVDKSVDFQYNNTESDNNRPPSWLVFHCLAVFTHWTFTFPGGDSLCAQQGQSWWMFPWDRNLCEGRRIHISFFPGLQVGRSEVCRSTCRQLGTNRSGRGLFRPHRPFPVQQDGGAARPASACRHTIQARLIRSRLSSCRRITDEVT